MPSVKKLLSKFTEDERRILELLMEALVSFNWRGLNIKKLKGYDDIFRLRKGRLRIIFAKNKSKILILSIDRRSEDTYRF